MPAQVDRRAAGDADRFDRHLRRQDRDRRHARQDRRHDRDRQVGQERRTSIRRSRPSRPTQRVKVRRLHGRVLPELHRKGRGGTPHDARAHRRGRPGARLDRCAGEATAGWSTSLGGLDTAVSIAKQRARIPADEEVELVVYSPRRSFYEAITELGRSSSAFSSWGVLMDAAQRRAVAALATPVSRLPPRRAARTDAVCVRPLDADDPPSDVGVDLDLHPLLRLRHVGGEEQFAPFVEQLGPERFLSRLANIWRHVLALGDAHDHRSVSASRSAR